MGERGSIVHCLSADIQRRRPALAVAVGFIDFELDACRGHPGPPGNRQVAEADPDHLGRRTVVDQFEVGAAEIHVAVAQTLFDVIRAGAYPRADRLGSERLRAGQGSVETATA